MRRSSSVLLASLLLVLGAAAAGCTGDDGGSAVLGAPAEPGTADPSPSPSAPDKDARKAPDPALQEFYDQEPAWKDCGDDNECAEVEAPLDYAKPGGERITLALLRNPADGDRVGNLVVNPGGPGSPGTDYAKNAGFAFGKPTRDAFDIVGFDPRGTGESTAVDCLTDRELDAYIALDPEPDDRAEEDQLVDAAEEMGAGCAEKSGALAAHVSTAEAARDMDLVRAVLGDGTLTYFGASYGTKLGATYAELFPERVGRLVLDGAVDVSLSGREASLGQAEGFERALTAYVEHCIDEGDCPLGDSPEEAKDTITGFLDDVDREPLEVGSRELAVGNAFYGIIAPLYNDDYWDSLLTPALEQALNGKGSMLLTLSDLYSSRSPDGSYSNNSSEAIYAINCLDDPSFTPARKIPGQFDAFEKASPTFGRVFAWGLVGCIGQEVEQADPIGKVDGKGAAPILVVGTTRDPATPYEWAQALASQLDSAVLLTRDGDGHTGYNMGNDCVDDTIEAYLLDGDVPSADKDCGS